MDGIMKQIMFLVVGLCLALIASEEPFLVYADGPKLGCGNVAHPGSKRIALTFDDGYDSVGTNRLLDVLEREQVHATFFPVATWAKEDPTTIARIRIHHEIGNHTATHPRLTQLSDEAIRREILNGVSSRIFRPPYGISDNRVRAIAESLGYSVVLWDIDTRDYAGMPSAQEVAEVVKGAGDGKIVLMHMGKANTIEAVPSIVSQLRAQGYRFVTVSELGRERKVSSTYKRWPCEFDFSASRLKIYAGP